MKQNSIYTWICFILPSLPLLKQLRWIPLVYRIKFKLATVTYRTLSTQQPTYLVNLLHFSDISRTLGSSVSKQRFVPKTKLNIDERAFSVAATTLWNQLPFTSKYSETSCKTKLGTFSAVPCSNDNVCLLSPCMTSQMILFVVPLILNCLRI